MIKLYDNGVYLLNGTEILEDTGNVSLPVSKEEAAKNTIAYGILDSHNTSGMLLLREMSDSFRRYLVRSRSLLIFLTDWRWRDSHVLQIYVRFCICQQQRLR